MKLFTTTGCVVVALLVLAISTDESVAIGIILRLLGLGTPKDKCVLPVQTDCGSACPTTCDNRNDEGTVCTDQCISGLACPPKTIIYRPNCCVKPKDCPN